MKIRFPFILKQNLFFHYTVFLSLSCSEEELYFPTTLFWGRVEENNDKTSESREGEWWQGGLVKTFHYCKLLWQKLLYFLFSMEPNSKPCFTFHSRSSQARMLYMMGRNVKYKGGDAKATWINKLYTLSLQTLSYPSKAAQLCCWRTPARLLRSPKTKWYFSHVSGNADTQVIPPLSHEGVLGFLLK